MGQVYRGPIKPARKIRDRKEHHFSGWSLVNLVSKLTLQQRDKTAQVSYNLAR